jgi:polyisoprenoid-binding protein YceI
MKKYIKPVVVGVLLVAAVGVAVFAYVTRPIAAPSEDITQVAEQLPPPSNSTSTSTSTPAAAQITTYRIAQSGSEAQFSINEVLRGEPNTAIGTTSQIGGDVQLNTTNPSKSQVGTISVNARTLKTDSDKRDGAIGRYILKSEDAGNEFITFGPVTVSGMPAKITKGTPFSFTLSGNLTIAGVTKTATFHGTATLVSDTVLNATASTTVKRSDFGLTIPSVPFVASVEDNVILSVTIVADKVEN